MIALCRGVWRYAHIDGAMETSFLCRGIISKVYRIMIDGATETLFVCVGIVFEAYAIRPYIFRTFRLTPKTIECRHVTTF